VFQLHDQLRKDTTIVSENDACVLLLANDARYPWLIGNQVPQLHVHHIVRYQNDAAWPSPIWGLGEAAVYTKTELDERLQQLRDGLSFCQ